MTSSSEAGQNARKMKGNVFRSRRIYFGKFSGNVLNASEPLTCVQHSTSAQCQRRPMPREWMPEATASERVYHETAFSIRRFAGFDCCESFIGTGEDGQKRANSVCSGIGTKPKPRTDMKQKTLRPSRLRQWLDSVQIAVISAAIFSLSTQR